MSPLRYPPVQGGQIRIEGYLVPQVTSWPSYPSWSPDGREIAFSMDGRIWRIPVEGGAATQITTGPGYDFEPDWSHDGARLVFSRDVSGNLDIYAVSREGEEERRLTEEPALEFHPRFDRKGGIVYASAVSGNFDLYRLASEEGAAHPLYDWPSNEIQPDPSSAGDEIVFVSSRSGRIGAGGIFVDGKEIQFEETSFRTRPAFSPDGKTIAFVSDAGGSRAIFLLPAGGGIPLPLTREADLDAFAPAWSPDGEQIVYVVNRGGKGALEIQPIQGGSSRPVSIRERHYPASVPMGRLRVSLSHPARVSILGADGRYYAPADFFRRIDSFTELHYFHAAGSFELDVPAGATRLLVAHGPEYEPIEKATKFPQTGPGRFRSLSSDSPTCLLAATTRAIPTCTISMEAICGSPPRSWWRRRRPRTSTW